MVHWKDMYLHAERIEYPRRREMPTIDQGIRECLSKHKEGCECWRKLVQCHERR